MAEGYCPTVASWKKQEQTVNTQFADEGTLEKNLEETNIDILWIDQKPINKEWVFEATFVILN